MAGFDPGDEEWAAIEPLLPKKGRGPARHADARTKAARQLRPVQATIRHRACLRRPETKCPVTVNAKAATTASIAPPM